MITEHQIATARDWLWANCREYRNDPESLSLGEKQRVFMACIHILLGWIYEKGYTVSAGDFLAKDGHMKGSLHYIKLAADLNLFRRGEFLTKTEDHKMFGEAWEGLHDLCRWGGRFTKPDGNHFSLTHGGKA